MRISVVITTVLLVATWGVGITVRGQQTERSAAGQVEQIFEDIGEGLEEAWAQARRTVDRLGVQGRVYGRLRWDQALSDATLDIGVAKGVVTLRGSVPTKAAKEKAVRLTEDTVGVREVIDKLAVLQNTEQ